MPRKYCIHFPTPTVFCAVLILVHVMSSFLEQSSITCKHHIDIDLVPFLLLIDCVFFRNLLPEVITNWTKS